MANFGTNFIVVPMLWPEFKAIVSSKNMSMQYDFIEDPSGMYNQYQIFALDQPIVYVTDLWNGTKPDGIGGMTQAENDTYYTEFNTTYKNNCNKRINSEGAFNDQRLLHRFGNVTTTATTEITVASRLYTEPTSQAQRSVVSTSATDKDSTASGARAVKITYLDSNYVLKTETVLLNGTTAVNTVATDIRFIERFEVVKGTDAVGAIRLMTTTGGGGTEICGIGVATNEAFLCHHYVPAGSVAYIYGWGASVDDEASFKLKGQQYFNGNLVEQILDLEKLFGITTPPGRVIFYRNCVNIKVPAKTYVRITTVPGQTTSTTIRTFLDLWETQE